MQGLILPRGWAAAALGLLLAVSAPEARAWSMFAHEQIAELAERELDPVTRAAALALLEGEAGSLAEVGAWADRIRDEPGWDWASPLHFVNFPKGQCDYVAERDCPDGSCVVGAIERFRAELADAALPRAQRAVALKFLVHFVADVHQPLHAGFGHDKGGNTFQVNIDGRGSNLHRVWDFELPARNGEDHAAQMRTLAAAPLPPAGELEPPRWAEESCRVVLVEGFYPSRRRLAETYFERHLPQAQARMRLAASRLAALLEDALGSSR